ncbi:type IV secretion system DNA-binding domain-containing protein [Endozoicomonas lisbonensis]|uniref:Type IV secretory pathway TraG/TraD family ATPase VirD4 n=1 Tax=Endozoicomonas lisbonensis TaxID=3120522 RepID=A0ABV2SBK2_9GAMM
MPSTKLKTLERLSPLLALLISVAVFTGITSSQARHETAALLSATLNVQVLQDSSYNLPVRTSDGQVYIRSGNSIIDDTTIQRSAMVTLAATLATVILFVALWMTLKVFCRSTSHVIQRRKAIESDKNRLIEAADLRKITSERASSSRMQFAGIPMPDKSDTSHLIVVGSPGSGKSVNIKETLIGIRAAGRKAIVFDINGEFISHFYRQDKDIILNPMDERSAAWDIWCECNRNYDYMRMAKALIPEHKMEQDWSTGARIVLAKLAQDMGETENPSTEALLEQIRDIEDSQIVETLSETDAAPILAKWGEEEACMGIRGVLISSITPMQELSNDNFRFSVRRWAFNENDDSWLFISTHSDEIDLLRPLTTVWLEFACSTLISLPPDHLRRFFFVVDDLTQVNLIPSLQNFMIQSRKIGACAILGIDSVTRLTEIYGMSTVQAISRSCESWATMRCSDYTTAKWASTKLGKRNTVQKTEITYHGKNQTQTTERQLTMPIVSPEEIHELSDMQGFIRMGGDHHPVAKFNSVARGWPIIAQAFIPRAINEEEEEESILNSSADDNTKSPEVTESVESSNRSEVATSSSAA